MCDTSYLCRKFLELNLYFSETTVRWSDLDANFHLANSSFMNFTSFARIDVLRKCGITLADLAKNKIGPAILREEISYFKEAHEGQEVMISVAITGQSENGEIYEFEHNLYDKQTGTHLAYSRLLGVWFSTAERKKMPPPEELKSKLEAIIDSENCKILSMKDLKDLPVHAKSIDPKIFQSC